MTEVIHASSEGFFLQSMTYIQNNPLKPTGLWVSPLINDSGNFTSSWLRWCRDSGFWKHTHFYHLLINPVRQNEITFINTKEDYFHFKEKYFHENPSLSMELGESIREWDWGRVAAENKALYFNRDEIYPRGLKFDEDDLLLYSLDCNSYVFFDTSLLIQLDRGEKIDFSLGIYDD